MIFDIIYTPVKQSLVIWGDCEWPTLAIVIYTYSTEYGHRWWLWLTWFYVIYTYSTEFGDRWWLWLTWFTPTVQSLVMMIVTDMIYTYSTEFGDRWWLWLTWFSPTLYRVWWLCYFSPTVYNDSDSKWVWLYLIQLTVFTDQCGQASSLKTRRYCFHLSTCSA